MPANDYTPEIKTRESILEQFNSNKTKSEKRFEVIQYADNTKINIVSTNVTFNNATDCIKIIIDKIVNNLTTESSQELDVYNDFASAINQFCQSRIKEIQNRLEK